MAYLLKKIQGAKGGSLLRCCFMYRFTPPQCFVRLGGHQLVQTGIAGEAVFKRYNVASTADETAASRYIGDVAKLGVRDMEQICQFIPVGGGLVQKEQKLRVCQHQAGSIGTEQLVG